MSLARRLRFQFKYFRNPPWDTGISPPELMDFIANHPAGSALDLGCGTGTNAITLARHGWQVTGIDFAWRAIKVARRKASQAGVNVDLWVGDILNPDNLAGQFDLILDIGCYHSLDTGDQQTYIQNLERFLAPQGKFLMYGFFRGSDETGPGMLEEDVDRISSRLNLVNRVDSTERGLRSSVWLTYQRRHSENQAGKFNETLVDHRKI